LAGAVTAGGAGGGVAKALLGCFGEAVRSLGIFSIGLAGSVGIVVLMGADAAGAGFAGADAAGADFSAPVVVGKGLVGLDWTTSDLSFPGSSVLFSALV
jgi:hypothetical protein